MPKLVPEQPHESKPIYSLYEASRALKSCGIHCSIWCEGLLWHLNARTILFDHFFLVADPEAAAQALEHLGYRRLEIDFRYRFMMELFKGAVRLAHPSDPTEEIENDSGIGTPAAILLPAATWHFPIDQLNEMTDVLPPIPLVASSFIDTWLDAETIALQACLLSYLSYTVAYVKQAQIPRFEDQLQFGYQRDIWHELNGLSMLGSKRLMWLKQREAERPLDTSHGPQTL